MHGDDNTYIRTWSGKKFWPLDPRAEDIDIRDIAHHLARLNRFTGAIRYDCYSVAEHSVRVSLIVNTRPHELPMQALLHDATEAYLNDLSRPVKYDSDLAGYRQAEQRLWWAIAKRFSVSPLMYPETHRADNILMLTEKRDLMSPVMSGDDRRCKRAVESDVAPLPKKIYPLSAQVAEEWFVDRFVELGGKL